MRIRKKDKAAAGRGEVPSRLLDNGIPGLRDLIAPAFFDRSSPDHIQVDHHFVRSFLVAGYPRQIGVGWADRLYDYEGDLDLAIHVSPMDERVALEELTAKITQFEAQLATELEKGSNRHVTLLQSRIQDLYEERSKAEQNYISLFAIQMVCSLYASSLEQLNRESRLLENGLRGRKVKLMPAFLRQDQAYKSALPFGRSWLPQNYRNFSSEGLTACFPFYNSELSHPSGVFLGVNTQTRTPIYIDFFDRRLLDSGNATVFGMTGSGKSFLVSLLTMRSALKGIRTAIVDPEGEYRTLTEALGGVNVKLSPRGAVPNPFEVREEEETDREGRPTGRRVVPLKDKIHDLLNLISIMVPGLEQQQKSLVSLVLSQTYEDFHITEDPESLVLPQAVMNARGQLVHAGRRRTMPTLSDFHQRLVQYCRNPDCACLVPVAQALRMFLRGEPFGLFDGQTPPELAGLGDSPVVTFDVSELNSDILRPLGMYIALSWCMEKFANQDLSVPKRIVCDEAWMMVCRSLPASTYTARFLETVARRIRKRNGSLLVASQNFKEFADNPQGQAVLTNTHVNLFLRQNATDLDAVQQVFRLSDGERDFLASPRRGHFLLKMGRESTTGYASPFPWEKEQIEKATAAARGGSGG